MKIVIAKISYYEVRKLVNPEVLKSKYCEKLDNFNNNKQVQRNAPNWEDTFLEEHYKCGQNKKCIESIRVKCIYYGRKKLFQEVNPLTDCLFPLTKVSKSYILETYSKKWQYKILLKKKLYLISHKCPRPY